MPSGTDPDPVRRQKQGGGGTLWAWKHGIPNIVISEKGLFCTGPQVRNGPMTGPSDPAGFPMLQAR